MKKDFDITVKPMTSVKKCLIDFINIYESLTTEL